MRVGEDVAVGVVDEARARRRPARAGRGPGDARSRRAPPQPDDICLAWQHARRGQKRSAHRYRAACEIGAADELSRSVPSGATTMCTTAGLAAAVAALMLPRVSGSDQDDDPAPAPTLLLLVEPKGEVPVAAARAAASTLPAPLTAAAGDATPLPLPLPASAAAMPAEGSGTGGGRSAAPSAWPGRGSCAACAAASGRAWAPPAGGRASGEETPRWRSGEGARCGALLALLLLAPPVSHARAQGQLTRSKRSSSVVVVAPGGHVAWGGWLVGGGGQAALRPLVLQAGSPRPDSCCGWAGSVGGPWEEGPPSQAGWRGQAELGAWLGRAGCSAELAKVGACWCCCNAPLDAARVPGPCAPLLWSPTGTKPRPGGGSKKRTAPGGSCSGRLSACTLCCLQDSCGQQKSGEGRILRERCTGTGGAPPRRRAAAVAKLTRRRAPAPRSTSPPGRAAASAPTARCLARAASPAGDTVGRTVIGGEGDMCARPPRPPRPPRSCPPRGPLRTKASP